MRKGELNQRSSFQFELFKLNLIANGVIIAFALNRPDDWSRALLACPFISFILFSLWFHHALAIRLDPGEASNSPISEPKTFAQKFRRFSFAVAILSNFVFIPFAAIVLYQLKEYFWLSVLAITLLGIIILLFGFWFYLQYYKKDID